MADKAQTDITAVRGTHVTLVAKCPGKQDKIIFSSGTAAESNALCDVASSLLAQRTSNWTTPPSSAALSQEALAQGWLWELIHRVEEEALAGANIPRSIEAVQIIRGDLHPDQAKPENI